LHRRRRALRTSHLPGVVIPQLDYYSAMTRRQLTRSLLLLLLLLLKPQAADY
jgi:hypothetical protein